jgi:hypothetical protein
MKANKKTLMAVKRYLQEQEGWDLDEVISDIISETGMLKSGDTTIIPDECTIVWGTAREGDDICDLQDFIDTYTDKFIENICNILDSFVGDDISCYFEDEDC